MKGTQLHLFSGEEHEKLQNRRNAVVLPLDTMILVVVVIILLLALSFSLGVEKGRRNAAKSFDKERQILLATKENSANTEIAALMNPAVQPPIPLAKPAPLQTAAPAQVMPAPVEPAAQTIEPPARLPVKIKPPAAASEPKAAGTSGKKYAIQVASYTNKEPAQAALKKVLQSGYPAYIAQKGKFIAIIVGDFKDEKSAKSALEVLKKTHKDCILKKI